MKKEQLPEREWANQYPLSTFSGETKKELIVLIEHLLEEERKNYENKLVW